MNKEVKEKSLNNDKTTNKFLLIKIMVKAAVSFVLVLGLLLIGYSHSDHISKLSIINMDVYLIIGLIFVILNLAFIIFALFIYLNFEKDKILGKYIYSTYSVHDLSNFVINIVYVIFFILVFIITPTTVSGSSMNNTLFNGDRLLVWHLNYSPERDDVVIVDINKNYSSLYSYSDEEFYIKRVVALSGDEIKYVPVDDNYGMFYVNDELVEDNITYNLFKTTLFDYASDTYYMKDTNTGVVPDGFVIVMGDNRDNSTDSRYLGLIHKEDLLGKAVFRYYSKKGNVGKIGKVVL